MKLSPYLHCRCPSLFRRWPRALHPGVVAFVLIALHLLIIFQAASLHGHIRSFAPGAYGLQGYPPSMGGQSPASPQAARLQRMLSYTRRIQITAILAVVVSAALLVGAKVQPAASGTVSPPSPLRRPVQSQPPQQQQLQREQQHSGRMAGEKKGDQSPRALIHTPECAYSTAVFHAGCPATGSWPRRQQGGAFGATALHDLPPHAPLYNGTARNTARAPAPANVARGVRQQPSGASPAAPAAAYGNAYSVHLAATAASSVYRAAGGGAPRADAAEHASTALEGQQEVGSMHSTPHLLADMQQQQQQQQSVTTPDQPCSHVPYRAFLSREEIWQAFLGPT